MDNLTDAILPALTKACQLQPGNEWHYDTRWGWGRTYHVESIDGPSFLHAIVWEPNSPREKHRFMRIMGANNEHQQHTNDVNPSAGTSPNR